MALVALAMVAIIAMAVISIDLVTLYLAREEAQRAADEAALAAAKIISLSGITGDPNNSTGNWAAICGTSGLATQVATSTAAQNTVGGTSTAVVTVTYEAGGSSGMSQNTDCTALARTTAFGVNPLVLVQVQRTGLPTFFSRIWGYTGQTITVSATAEAFNSSDSGTANQGSPGTIVPVQPRCVKPWVVPNYDPRNKPNCSGTGFESGCKHIVRRSDGAVENPGISLGAGLATSGIIGETFWLVPDCQQQGQNCNLLVYQNFPVQPQANSPVTTLSPSLLYVPGQVGTPVIGIPSCSAGDPYEEAIEGCDQPTNYSCGVQNNDNVIDLQTYNPISPTTTGVSCLIHQASTSDPLGSTGQDYLNTTSGTTTNPFGAPAAFPFQILAGSGSPLVSAGITQGSPISVSPSIVSLPIYDQTLNPNLSSGALNNVTFVGFLQVFINAVDQSGDMWVTVLNVAGCSDDATGASVIGNSPVPVRLITPP